MPKLSIISKPLITASQVSTYSLEAGGAHDRREEKGTLGTKGLAHATWRDGSVRELEDGLVMGWIDGSGK